MPPGEVHSAVAHLHNDWPRRARESGDSGGEDGEGEIESGEN